MSERPVLSVAVERGLECFHGKPRACEDVRCGPNCGNRFDYAHPCPACLNARIEISERLLAVEYARNAPAQMASLVALVTDNALGIVEADGWGDVDLDSLRARAVDGIAWGLLEATSDTTDRPPRQEALDDARATAERLLRTMGVTSKDQS